ALGVPKWKAYEWGNTRKGYWRIAQSPILHKTLGNSLRSAFQNGRHMSGVIPERVIGGSHKVQYYTKPLAIPSGIAKGF
ncbi:hypothetical protein AM506_00005, partial [Rossellomorea vietnamensis]